MTAEWLREFEGFENYTDAQAQEAIETIRSFADIMMGVYNKDENFSDDDELSRPNSIIR
jgi:hypothetical protein